MFRVACVKQSDKINSLPGRGCASAKAGEPTPPPLPNTWRHHGRIPQLTRLPASDETFPRGRGGLALSEPPTFNSFYTQLGQGDVTLTTARSNTAGTQRTPTAQQEPLLLMVTFHFEHCSGQIFDGLTNFENILHKLANSFILHFKASNDMCM